ncbi:MAG: replication initiator protein A [Methylobacterium organophilum]|nr:replication initiator protein A [Methylobacterium organophilum]
MAKQLSLVLDSPLLGKVKNDRNLMVWNFFSLTRDRVDALPVFEDQALGVRIEVRAKGTGVATIWDKQILIYIASIIQDKLAHGETVSQKFTFTAHDYFRVCRVSPGGSSYDVLEGALERLQGTQIKTNIETGGEGEEGAFSWISSYKVQYRRDKVTGDKVMKAVTLEVCDWFYRAVMKDQRLLTYNPDYFGLAPLERRLYEVARAHCGDQAGFRINIAKLQKRVGSDTELKKFKLFLMKLQAKRNALPDYYIALGHKAGMFRIDGPNPRVPLKSIMVLFGRKDRLQDLTWASAPIADNDDEVEAA